MSAPRISERRQSELIGGPRCVHDMIAAWCSLCLGHDDTLAMAVQDSGRGYGGDLVSHIESVIARRENRHALAHARNGSRDLGAASWGSR